MSPSDIAKKLAHKAQTSSRHKFRPYISEPQLPQVVYSKAMADIQSNRPPLLRVGKEGGKATSTGMKENFPNKTYNMIMHCSQNDPGIACWTAEGDSFIVFDTIKLAEIYLPQYFKHSNFQSFIRQLNLYGFRKIEPAARDPSGPRRPNQPVTYHHKDKYFIRGRVDLLRNIERSTSGDKPKSNSDSPGDSELRLERVEDDIATLTFKIDRIENKIDAMMALLRRSPGPIQTPAAPSPAPVPGTSQALPMPIIAHTQPGSAELGDWSFRQAPHLDPALADVPVPQMARAPAPTGINQFIPPGATPTHPQQNHVPQNHLPQNHLPQQTGDIEYTPTMGDNISSMNLAQPATEFNFAALAGMMVQQQQQGSQTQVILPVTMPIDGGGAAVGEDGSGSQPRSARHMGFATLTVAPNGTSNISMLSDLELPASWRSGQGGSNRTVRTSENGSGAEVSTRSTRQSGRSLMSEFSSISVQENLDGLVDG